MSKDTESRAVTPPKRIVTSSTSSRALAKVRPAAPPAGWGSDIDGLPFELLDLGLGAQRPSGTPRRQDALRPEGHDHHERDPEDQQPPVAEASEALGQIGDQHSAEEGAPPVARAADEDRRDEQHGQGQQEAVGTDEP